MATKLVERKVFVLSLQHAREAQDAPSIPGERPRKNKRVEYLTELIDDSQFCRADFAYAKCKEDGKRYRVNGNHTSFVLCGCIDNADLPDFPEGIPLVVEEWECDVTSELIDIFDSYDNPQSNRTAGDRLGVHIAMHVEALDGCSRDVIAASLRGINMVLQTSKNPDEPCKKQWDVGELLKSDEAIRFCHFIQPFKDDTWQGWKDKGVCAAVFRNWRDSEDQAEEIWSECFDEQNDNENSDSRKFVNRMRTERGRKQRTSAWFYSESLKYWKKRRKSMVHSK